MEILVGKLPVGGDMLRRSAEKTMDQLGQRIAYLTGEGLNFAKPQTAEAAGLAVKKGLLGSTEFGVGNQLGWLGQFKNEAATTGLYPDYKKSKTKTDEYWKTFKDSYYTNKFTNYIPYNLDKTRLMTYSKILSPTDVQQSNLKDIYSVTNSTWDKFNLKKTLN